MKKDLFTDGVSHIDLDAVERLLQIEQHLQAKQRRQKRTRWLIIPAAAMIALLVCMTAVIIPYIPRTLDIEYEPSKGAPENVWVYYQNENGTQKRERVHVPAGTQNVFAAWKHLNVVDDEVVIVDYKEQADDVQSTVVPGTLLEFLQQRFSPASKTVTVTLSAQITSYENYDALIESLTQTLAKYAGVAPEQIRILIDGEQIGTVFGGLQFYHSLHSTPMTVGTGSRLEITVGMINASNQNIEFTGSWGEFVPGAILTMGNTAVITHEPYDVTQEYQKYTLAPGESREITYTFLIPNDAAIGTYDLTLSFAGQEHTFPNAVTCIESTTTDLIKFWPTDPAAITLPLYQTNCALPTDIAQRLLDICQKSSWLQIEYEQTVPSLQFTVGSYELSYSTLNGTLCLDNALYAELSLEDRYYMNVLSQVLAPWHGSVSITPVYDAVIFIDGCFYGHNAQTDLKGEQLWSQNIFKPEKCSQDCLVAVQPGFDWSALLDRRIQDEGKYICIAGVWFERITGFETPVLAWGNQSSGSTISKSSALKIVNLLYQQSWTQGVLDMSYGVTGYITTPNPDYCGYFKYGLDSGIFELNGKYCVLSPEDQQVMNELFIK